MRIRRSIWALIAAVPFGAAGTQTAHALPSWNKGATRDRITTFVSAVTDEKGRDYVAPEARIAVFDNEGRGGAHLGDPHRHVER